MVKSRPAPQLDVKADVLVAARELFAAKGFEGTTLQDVADEVGVSKQGVLHHFASKEELRSAVLEQIVGHWSTVLPRLLLGAAGGHDRFTAVFGELVRFFSDEPDRARVVVREVLDRPTETRELMVQIVRPWLKLVADYVRAGQSAGRVHDDIDADAWVVHMLQLALVTAASTTVLAAGIEPQGRARLGNELNRIASVSLFKAAPATRKRR
jgi:AcrR family transcriptional regulator